MSCSVSEEQLWSWLDRQAPELEAHLAACPACRARAEQLCSVMSGIGAASATTRAPLPETIGPYRIKRLLGEGGMGLVYEAEQPHPHRFVALKVLRGGLYSASRDEHLLKLFQREVQTLARLKHPGIAALYEAGRTEDGQHYFTMELVEERPLNRYVRDHALPTRRRLELFGGIARAVNYAHQRGVIHRDLKPSNIVIDAEGNPKILDFGLARITGADVALATSVTELGQLRGTLPYMSPEQVRGDPDPIDLRSDVYALGVILYELLTDELPYQVSRVALPEAARIICEQPPRRPSSVRRVLRGDLETIVLKALEKDPERRYPSAAALADDVERYLSNQPILAHPPSTTYQLLKFAKRNKAVVIGLAAAMAALCAGTGLATWQAVRAARQAARADEQADHAARQAERASRIQGFLHETLTSIDPARARGRDVSLLREILDTAAGRVEAELAGQPQAEASLRNTMGMAYFSLGEYAAAGPHLEKALNLRRGLLGQEHRDTLESMHNLALLYKSAGRYGEAEPLYRQTVELCRRVLGPDHPDTLTALNNLAVLYESQGRYAEAEPILSELMAHLQRVYGEEHPATLTIMSNLAVLYEKQDRCDQAEPLHVRALEIVRRVQGEDHPDTLTTMSNLAVVYGCLGRSDEATPLLEQVLEARRRVLGDAHVDTIKSIYNLARNCQDLGRDAQAEPLFLDALARFRQQLGEGHPNTLVCLRTFAALRANQGRYAEAEQLLAPALEDFRQNLGPDHPDALACLRRLGAIYRQLARYTDAESLLVEVLESCRRRMGEHHESTVRAAQALVELYDAWGRPERAAEYRAMLARDNGSKGPTP